MAVTNHGNGTIEMDAAADSITGNFKLLRVDWVNPTNATHTLVVNDSKGNLIYRGIAGGTGFTLSVAARGKIYNGLTVATLGSGTVTFITE